VRTSPTCSRFLAAPLGAIFIVSVVTLLTPATAAADIYVYQTEDGGELVTSERRSHLKLLRVIEGSAPANSTSAEQTTSSSSSSSEEATRAARARQRAEQARQKARQSGELDNRNIGRTAAYDDLIQEAAEAYDVPFPFIKAVIRVESNFRRFATSHAGAMGLMQLMPATAESLSVTDPFDPRQNVYGGTKLLRQLIDRYNGDINLVLSAYNAGGAAVAQYDGIPYAQTREYVASVVKWYRHYKQQGDTQ
jgi:soluble lytic murein transglycosylase-like protein